MYNFGFNPTFYSSLAPTSWFNMLNQPKHMLIRANWSHKSYVVSDCPSDMQILATCMWKRFVFDNLTDDLNFSFPHGHHIYDQTCDSLLSILSENFIYISWCTVNQYGKDIHFVFHFFLLFISSLLFRYLPSLFLYNPPLLFPFFFVNLSPSSLLFCPKKM